VNFAEAEAYLYSLGNEVETMKLGLENITILLAALGDPQTKYKKVQVAGTNGKGSVCAFLDSICGEAGIRRGLYTSPHLVSITERIKIDGVDISEDEFASIATLVRETSERLVLEGKLERVPTFFEQVTAMALVAFVDAGVELAILETGLGGRYDAVTAAKAEIAAITRVDLDHQEYLGDTIEEIAAEKAAIIRGDSAVCIGVQKEVVRDVLAARCLEVGVEPVILDPTQIGYDQSSAEFAIGTIRTDEVFVSLPGLHQVENAGLAILIAQQLSQTFVIDDEHILRGLEATTHPGRLETVWRDGVSILLDGAHNVLGAEALRDYLLGLYSETQICIVFGAMTGKNADLMLRLLLEFGKDVILTKPNNSRSEDPDLIRTSLGVEWLPDRMFVIHSVKDAIESAIEFTKNYSSMRRALVVVTGSLYLVGEVKKILQTA